MWNKWTLTVLTCSHVCLSVGELITLVTDILLAVLFSKLFSPRPNSHQVKILSGVETSLSYTHTDKWLSTKQWLVLGLTWGLFLSHCGGQVTLRSWCSLYAWPVFLSIAGLSKRMSTTLWMWGISHHGWVIVSPRWKSLNCGLCCTQPCRTQNHEIWQKQKTCFQWEALALECFCIAQLLKD